MDVFLEVLKWIGIALAAGFVGYFGRYPAKILIEKIFGARKITPEKMPEKQANGGQIELEKKRLKVEKKAAKQAVKTAKKAGKRGNGIS